MSGSPARRFGAFEALELLVGKGGQGRLFAARCLEEGVFDGLHAGDEVVLKAMPVRADDPEKAYRRLSRRTAALVAARHPGIVRYFGCFETEGGGIDDAMHVVVMELLHGETLEERLKREPLGLDGAEALAIVRTCLEALVHAASFGIVHRDIKPSNVFLCEDGSAKLIDFEVARQATGAQTTTESGAMQGTFDYMAPDFHPNFRPDPKFRGDQCSDVFSLAVTLHEMLTGRRPYAAGPTLGDQSMMAFFQRWTKSPDSDPRRAVRVDGVRVHALRHLQRTLRKALRPDRAERFQTYAEFLAALAEVRPRTIEGGVDRYRLSKCVGKGGFGVVYKAFRESNGDAVAVKVLLRAEYAERFDREGRVLMRFDDDRIVTFVEAFAAGDPVSPTHFLVMRYLDGMPGASLKDRLGADPSRRGLPRSEIVPAFVRFAEGLQILHAEGVYHRDIKPANLYCPAGAPERACLMDLGVVRTEETHTNGGLPGTLDYMAPELATGSSRGDASADVYALGLCLYEALTGRTAYPRLPRGSEGIAAFYARAQAETPPDLSGLEDEPELLALLQSMVAVRREERPASAARAAELLRAVPVRETATAAAADAAAVASGSEDSTDDLVFPVPVEVSAATPPEPVPAGGPETETAAVLPERETQSLPAVPVADGETQAVPLPTVAEGGETQTVPDERPAESASAAEGETQAVVSGVPPAEGETAAMPETAAAEAVGETQATNVAETVATAALDASETLATRATQATQATESAQTVRATESANVFKSVPSPAVRKKTERSRPPAGGVREIKPKSGIRTFFAAAAVLVLCGVAACAVLFQHEIEKFFEKKNQPTSVSKPTPTKKDNPQPVTHPTPPPDPEPPNNENPFERRVKSFEINQNPSSADQFVHLSGTAKKLLADLEKEGFDENATTGYRNRINEKMAKFVSVRTNDFSNQVSGTIVREETKTNFDEAIKKLESIRDAIKNESNQIPEDFSAAYTRVLNELDKKISGFKTNLDELAAHEDARKTVAELKKKANESLGENTSSEKREKAIQTVESCLEKWTWEDVKSDLVQITNRLESAESAFLAAQTNVSNAKEATGFDGMVSAFDNLSKEIPGLPTDGTNLVKRARLDLAGKMESDAAQCTNETSRSDHQRNLKTVEIRLEKLKGKRGLEEVYKQYETISQQLSRPVELTITNESKTAIHMSGIEPEFGLSSNESKTINVEQWKTIELTAAATGNERDDWEEKTREIEIGNENKNQAVKLSQKEDPEVVVKPAEDSPALEVSLDETSWLPLDREHTFSLEPRTNHSVHWRVKEESLRDDYETAQGTQSVETRGRGTKENLTLPKPNLKSPPTVTIENEIPNGPALRVKVEEESAGGPAEEGRKAKLPATIELAPRKRWRATFEFVGSAGDEWMPVEPIEFETGSRGKNVTKKIKTWRRPVCRVKNTGFVTFEINGKTIKPNEVETFRGEVGGRQVETMVLKDDSWVFKGGKNVFEDRPTAEFSFGEPGSAKDVSASILVSGSKVEKFLTEENGANFEEIDDILKLKTMLEIATENGQTLENDVRKTCLDACLDFSDGGSGTTVSEWVSSIGAIVLARVFAADDDEYKERVRSAQRSVFDAVEKNITTENGAGAAFRKMKFGSLWEQFEGMFPAGTSP